MAQETEYRLRKIQFTKALRGYSCEEVDTYLAYVNDRYHTLGKECSELKKKMAVMAAGQNEFREDALREKDKIAAEADALVKEKELAAGKLMEDAKRKAARILADAEAAAAGILKRAEDETVEIRAKQQEEDDAAMRNAGRMIAERNNTADRLVEEIDSFREEIFAMYAAHIEALEQLAQRTDAFYQTKEELTKEFVSDGESAADDMELPAGEDDAGEVYMTADAAAEAEPSEKAETAAEDAPADDEWMDAAEEETEADDDLLRIDWKKHRASRDEAESETMAEKTLWEIADEAVGQSAWDVEENESADAPEDIDDVLDSLENKLAADAGDTDAFADEGSFASFEDVYEDGEEGSAETDDAEFDLLPEDEYEEEEDVPAEEISEEDFLSDIASEYIEPSRNQLTNASAKAPAKPAQESARRPVPAQKKKAPADLEELFYDEESKNVSLTGEFDIIFNSKKSAANVTEISRQPLVEAQKPEKPKKHSTK